MAASSGIKIVSLIFKRLLPAVLAVTLIAAFGFRTAAHIREDVPFGVDLPENGSLVATREGQIFALQHGDDGPLLVFSHGTAAWSGLWEPTLIAMGQQNYRAMGFDMPPFGFSEHAADADYSISRQADRVLAMISELPDRPILVAHSVSASPVVEAVMRDPSQVAGLVVVAGAIGLGSHETPSDLPGFLQPKLVREAAVAGSATNPLLTATFLRGFLHIEDAATPEVIEVLKRPMGRDGYTEAVSAWVPSLLATPENARSTRPENWADLQVPTAFVWGDKDTVTPLDQGQALAAMVPNSKLIVLNDVGHIPQIEAPEAFQGALIEALNHVIQNGDPQ
ncbi:MAG: alpha/beta hydrolase [Pseudomonadota bacterium]